ncbi:sensor histidine kinase [Staphylococcus massiliensis]|uniref:histidine kinase n=1 Tax=Staphylococcus massiliensis S46 TaxID=1229783 RepID=K9B2X5_9STAP|nr:sensor histidine kinase [Staphylococcus massiliensis]EKU48130.1 signal transduction histidine kinase LytS [Staphylococcus massiliensis S46]MCG3399607.1 sensor histidine kinase [Staphylococcus massiliensis]MCG3402118.1 sensor histidine kinase [Staphylococcus massiliensis]MCG3413312.1 sensor histidine kinase [Staphylococcus massiliensis]PNZ99002.1 sensor histidine kinase [Staphylococcus massiliensis CCUG 55927]
MFNLTILLLERVGLIIILAYLLMNLNYFKKTMNYRETWHSKWQLCLVFSLFALMSNFTGIVIQDGNILSGSIYFKLNDDVSLANTRVLTIGVAGLVGGPFVGLFVGIISGLFRLYMGGAEAYTYLISSFFIGIISGYFGRRARRHNQYPTVFKSALIGSMMEVVQMICIFSFAQDKTYALELLSLIALPMIIVNGIGTAIFMSIIISTLKHEEQMRAVQTEDVLEITKQTLPYFKEGLNESSAKEVAKIIKDLMKVSAVAITSRKDILAHVGVGSDHHIPKKAIITHLSKEVLQTGQLKEVHTKVEIGCSHPDCPLHAAIVIPLKSHGKVIGTLKMYFTNPNNLTFVERKLAEGLAQIFGSQIELGVAETQGKLLKDAEIKSLQAQVNPHFFFNAINTISAMVRIDSEKARDLLLELSHFFRSNLQGSRQNTITLEKELSQVLAYLSLEQARFPGRFNVKFDVKDTFKDALVPPFLVQILVENAIKHAFTNRKKDNDITIRANQISDHELKLSVIDNGHGIDKAKIAQLGLTSVESESGTGSALENLNRRLKGLFSEQATLHFDSNEHGTNVWCILPYQRKEHETCAR